MSKTLPPGKKNEKPKNGALVAPPTIASTEPPKKNGEPLKENQPVTPAPIISNSEPLPKDKKEPEAVKVNVESQADPGKKDSSILGILKTAKARAAVNQESGETEPEKRSHKKGEGTGRPRGRPSNKDNEDEFTSLVFTILTIALSFSGIPPELRPFDDEVNSLAYNIGAIIARHIPAIGNIPPDIINLMGITGILGVWYQRVAPELKRMQAERVGTQAPRKIEAKSPNGHKPQGPPAPPEEEVSGDPIHRLSDGSAGFLDHVHDKGGKDDNGSN